MSGMGARCEIISEWQSADEGSNMMTLNAASFHVANALREIERTEGLLPTVTGIYAISMDDKNGAAMIYLDIEPSFLNGGCGLCCRVNARDIADLSEDDLLLILCAVSSSDRKPPSIYERILSTIADDGATWH
jgi:hypothetical protein